MFLFWSMHIAQYIYCTGKELTVFVTSSQVYSTITVGGSPGQMTKQEKKFWKKNIKNIVP
jgi:hypothetical protein